MRRPRAGGMALLSVGLASLLALGVACGTSGKHTTGTAGAAGGGAAGAGGSHAGGGAAGGGAAGGTSEGGRGGSAGGAPQGGRGGTAGAFGGAGGSTVGGSAGGAGGRANVGGAGGNTNLGGAGGGVAGGGGGGGSVGGSAGGGGNASAGVAGGSGGAPVALDPAPGVDLPGAHGGALCPTSGDTVFSVAAGATSSYELRGTVAGASGSGTWYVRGPKGEEVGGALELATDGTYAKTVPLFCGDNLLKVRFANGSCPLVLVYAISRTTCNAADIAVTLQWDALGRDWELHLIKPGGHINDNATDCTWTSCIGTSPDWGVLGDASDDPHKDIDNTGAYGPENVWLAKPETGTYTVMVEHWNGAGDPLSSGSVILNVLGHTVTVDKVHLAPYSVWKAATITFPGGVVQTSQDTVDCSSMWNRGCLLPLP